MKRNCLISTMLLLAGLLQAAAQGTAFTYQGRLNSNGSPASGTYSLTFSLFNTNSSGVAIAGTVTNNGVTVSNGLFTVLVDFGSGAFTGATNWLEIDVATNGVKTFTILAPRQQLTPTPYAIYSSSAGMAGTAATATSADFATSATTANSVAAGSITSDSIANGQVVKRLNGLVDAVTLSAGANVTISPSGNTLLISAAAGGSSCSGVPSMQVFSSSGTFTVPAGVNRIMVAAWGGGGGGGASYSQYSGGGGGGGGFGQGVFSVTPGTMFTITVGAGGSGGWATGAASQNGGTTSFGSLLFTTGGGASQNAGLNGPQIGGLGGTSSATFNVTGTQGSGGASGSSVSSATSSSQAYPAGGAGGASGGNGGGGGGGGCGKYNNIGTQNPGSNGAAPGGGGGGGGTSWTSSGGNGGNGMVVVYW